MLHFCFHGGPSLRSPSRSAIAGVSIETAKARRMGNQEIINTQATLQGEFVGACQ